MKEINFRLIENGKIVGYEEHRHIENPLNKKLTGIYIYHSRTGHGLSRKNISMNDNEKCFIRHNKKDAYTGLKDKHGKEIYAFDVVRIYGFRQYGELTFDQANPLAVIKYGKYWAGFYYELLDNPEYNFDILHKETAKKCEVIGNLWENPELWEKKEENNEF